MPEQPQQPLIRTDNLHKAYRMGRVDVPVLRGVNLAVNPGECIAVLGSSGSGKSTLMHIMGGLDRPTWPKRLDPPPTTNTDHAHAAQAKLPGEVFYKDKPLSKMKPGERDRYRRTTVGFVFQFYHLLPELSVIDNATIPARVGRSPVSWSAIKKQTTEHATELLEAFGLAHRLKHRPAELSGGERQRVAIARALINNPDLLLADEPTGNLDEKTGAAILDALMSIRETRNQTMVIVTHDNNTANRADRTIHLHDGITQT